MGRVRRASQGVLLVQPSSKTIHYHVPSAVGVGVCDPGAGGCLPRGLRIQANRAKSWPVTVSSGGRSLGCCRGQCQLGHDIWRGRNRAPPPHTHTLFKSGAFLQPSSASRCTERNSARRTSASSSETWAGGDSGPAPGASSEVSGQPDRTGQGGWGCAVHAIGAPRQAGPDRALPFLTPQRSPQAPSAPTDQPAQLAP